MEIKVFGPGCARCTETENMVKEVAASKGGDITVSKVTDLKEMMAAGIMATPAVSVDGVMKCKGRMPDREEIAAWIDGAAASPSGQSGQSAQSAQSGQSGQSGECCSAPAAGSGPCCCGGK